MNEIHGCTNESQKNRACPGHRKGRGPSSFWMQDPDQVFAELHLSKGDTFLDIGCGSGDYSLRAGREVGSDGIVYATDIQEGLVTSLLKRAEEDGLDNIRAVVHDIHDPLPVEGGSVDLCFISTVLHSLDRDRIGPQMLREIKRVLKTDGRLAVLECNKENLNFGPPLHMRISAEELAQFVSSHGLLQVSHADLGFNYLSTFRVHS